jgi:transglutaminase superfamily protein
MRGRAVTALAVLVAWIAGLGMLVRREFFRPHIERLAEAALRVTPAAMFYAVMQGDKQIGFASSTIDTTTAAIEQRDYLVADIPIGGTVHRATARTNVTLTRTLRIKTFEVSLEADENPVRVQGSVIGDTLLSLIVGVSGTRPDTQHVRLNGPILLPSLVPLAVALEEKPKVGKRYVLPVFDPAAMASRDVTLEVQAETLFVVNDSSVYDSTAAKWRGVLPDTVRAWQIVSQGGTGGGGGIGGWVDEQGRLVASSQMGFHLRREPYEVAFENWRRDADAHVATSPPPVSPNRDILEITAIAANKRLKSSVSQLRVRLGGVPLDGFNLTGGRQRLVHDTLVIEREGAGALAARYLAVLPEYRGRYAELRAEPFLEINHPEIVATAQRITHGSQDPRIIAKLLNTWVHDSVRKEVTVGIPSALHVLHTRRGDCNEHTQLFVALARAAGVPARVATGLAYLDGKFYYHAWPEVMLRGWVAVDPTFGQFPADAAHLRFVTGGLARQAELLRLVGNLNIDVIGSR